MPGSFFKFVGIDSVNLRNSKHMRRANLGNQLLNQAKKAKWSRSEYNPGCDLYISEDKKMYVFKGGEHYVLKGPVKTGYGMRDMCVSLSKAVIDGNGGMKLEPSDEGFTKTDKSIIKRFNNLSLDNPFANVPKASDEPKENLCEDFPDLCNDDIDLDKLKNEFDETHSLESSTANSDVDIKSMVHKQKDDDDVLANVPASNEPMKIDDYGYDGDIYSEGDEYDDANLEGDGEPTKNDLDDNLHEEAGKEQRENLEDLAKLINAKRQKVANEITNTVQIDENTSVSDDLGDNLLDYKNKSFSLPELFQITYDIIKSLRKFHNQEISHGDIKETNILVKRIGKKVKANVIDPAVACVRKISGIGSPDILVDRDFNGFSEAVKAGARFRDKDDPKNRFTIRSWLEKHSKKDDGFSDDYFKLCHIFDNMSHSYVKTSPESKFLEDLATKMFEYAPPLGELMKEIKSEAKKHDIEIDDD